MKNYKVMLTEYAKNLNDDELKFLYFRSTQLLCGDRADFVENISRDRDVDRWLVNAESSTEFFDMLDEISSSITEEYNSRFNS